LKFARTLAVFGAFTEGLQLFASFANADELPRFNKMKGMGQIVTWSARDETLPRIRSSASSRTFIEENKFILDRQLPARALSRLRHHRRSRGLRSSISRLSLVGWKVFRVSR